MLSEDEISLRSLRLSSIKVNNWTLSSVLLLFSLRCERERLRRTSSGRVGCQRKKTGFGHVDSERFLICSWGRTPVNAGQPGDILHFDLVFCQIPFSAERLWKARCWL